MINKSALQDVTLSNIAADLWDRVGIGVSGLCLVHCLIAPFALAVLPLWPAAFTLHAWLHVAFALVLIPITGYAMWGARRWHGSRQAAGLLGAGLLLVVAAAFGPFGEMSAAVVTILGSVLLVAGHWRNWRACRAHGAACHLDDHAH